MFHTILITASIIIANGCSLLSYKYPASTRFESYRRGIRLFFALSMGGGIALLLAAVMPSWHPLPWYALLASAALCGKATQQAFVACCQPEMRLEQAAKVVAWVLLAAALELAARAAAQTVGL